MFKAWQSKIVIGLAVLVLCGIAIFAWRWFAPAAGIFLLGLAAKKKPSQNSAEIQLTLDATKAEQKQELQTEAELQKESDALEDRIKKRRAKGLPIIIIVFLMLSLMSFWASVARADAEQDVSDAMALVHKYQALVKDKDATNAKFQDLVEFVTEQKAKAEKDRDDAMALVKKYQDLVKQKDEAIQKAIDDLGKAKAMIQDRDFINSNKDKLIAAQDQEIKRLKCPKWSPSAGGYWSESGLQYDVGLGQEAAAYWWRISFAPQESRIGITAGINF